MVQELNIRDERGSDYQKISELIRLAFENAPINDKREAEIVNLMRDDFALSISLVAELHNKIVGHIAFSKVTIDDKFNDWYGLAPVSVLPEYQSKSIGSRLIFQGIKLLKEMGAKGCVVLGESNYYRRFGFNPHAQLLLPGVPAEYFHALSFSDEVPCGTVKYHAAFG